MIVDGPGAGAEAVPVTEPEERDAVITVLADRRRPGASGAAQAGAELDLPGSESSHPGPPDYDEGVSSPALRGHVPHENGGLSPAVTKMLLAGLPGQEPAPRSAVDAVLGAPPRPTGPITPIAAAGYITARIRALAYTGRAHEAADLADRDGMFALHRSAGWAQDCTQAACYAVLAEAYLFTGRLRDSAACARFSLEYGRDAPDDRCVFRALSVLAAALAAGGELGCAQAAVDEAVKIGAPAGWITQYTGGPLLLAEVLIRARRADITGMAQSCAVLAAVEDADAVHRCFTRYCTLVLQAARQEYREMIAGARLLTHGADAARCPPYLLNSALALASLAHVHLGESGRGLAILEGRQSPPEHSVCFELLRATAYLHLGEFRKAIESTEECVTGNPDHLVITLTSVLLRRALAFEGLGLHSLADMEFSSANHLAFDSGLLSATIGLPVGVLETLSARMALNEPEFAAKVRAAVPEGKDYSSPPERDFVVPRLSGREAVIAGWLLTDRSLPAIADELHVSINTVKSQVSALYRKFGVSSRDEATMHLRRTGLYQPADGTKEAGKNG